MTHAEATALLASSGIHYTRKDYMDRKVSHHDYYKQFVTRHTKSIVLAAFGQIAIQKSTDPNFNDILLSRWDRIAPTVESTLIAVSNVTTQSNNSKPSYSLSDQVCILKAAARMIRDGE